MLGILKSMFYIIRIMIVSFWPIWVILIAFYILYVMFYYMKYKKSDYKYESGIKFFKFFFDKGSFGEGLTFMELEKLEQYGKIMTNLYLPTENNGTTEIDLVYITTSGIYVIESKNYSGWIFGSENSKNWTMIIYNYKTRFLNPIWQNKKHIKYLTKIISDKPVYSLIVFSERCELKKLNYNPKNVKVLKRNHLKKYLRDEMFYQKNLTIDEINKIYNELKKFSLVDDKLKEEHINNIRMKSN